MSPDELLTHVLVDLAVDGVRLQPAMRQPKYRAGARELARQLLETLVGPPRRGPRAGQSDPGDELDALRSRRRDPLTEPVEQANDETAVMPVIGDQTMRALGHKDAPRPLWTT